LALALERGVVPRLHVYGRPEDADVGIAKAIAAGEGIPLNHLDKAESARVAPDAYAALVERNYELFDGTPVDGVFDNGTDLASRREHVHDGAVLLNGGGGEVFRNFFYLRDRPLTTRQLVFAFFSRFDPAVCTATFDVERYTQSMADKLRDTVGNGDDELLRRDIEFLYAAFRCRYWMGNNNGVNNGLGFNLTPFIDATVVPDANATPLQFKNFGRLEAAMIRAVNPRLAAYPSAYGHAFDAEPSLRRRLGEQVSMLRPLWVRRYGYRVRSRSRGSAARPYFLETPYLRTVLDSSFPFMRRYFHVERLLDVEQFRRACTLELLFQRIDPIVDPSG
jgi:asparagine synthase (glutamine-hydrolysing)